MKHYKSKKIICVAIAPGSQFSSGLDLDGLLEFLTNVSPFAFKANYCKSYEDALAELQSGNSQMGWLGPFSSFEASRKGLIKPFAVGLLKGQKTPNYYSLFIVKTSSKIKNINGIKGKKLIIGNIHSTSGFIVPRRELNDAGINISQSSNFKEIIQTQNHDESINLLLNTDADVASVSSINLKDHIKRNKSDTNKIRIIHKSQPISGAPLVFSTQLAVSSRDIIKKLVLEAHNSVEIGGYGGKMEKYIDPLQAKQMLLESYIQSQWKWPTYLTIIGFILIIILSINDLDINFFKLFHNTFFYLGDVINRMIPPDFSNLNTLLLSMLETVEMAFLGTLLAILLSIPFGLLSASNISPNYFTYIICKTITIFFRAIPEFIMAMILVIAVGFGAIPGILALGLHTMGFLAKFYAEDIEHVNPNPPKAISSMNASRLQVLAFGIIPQILPSFMGNNLYILDRNVRMATMLGIVGAGGIGYELQSSFRMFNYPRVLAIIIMIFITIFIIDFISSFIRKKFL